MRQQVKFGSDATQTRRFCYKCLGCGQFILSKEVLEDKKHRKIFSNPYIEYVAYNNYFVTCGDLVLLEEEKCQTSLSAMSMTAEPD